MSARVARSALGARSALVTRSLYSTDKGGHRFSGRAVVAFSAAAGVTAALAVRFAMRGRGDPDDAAHRPDGSRAEVSVRSQVPRLVRVLYVDADGEQRVARIDEEEFTAEQDEDLLADCPAAFFGVELRPPADGVRKEGAEEDGEYLPEGAR